MRRAAALLSLAISLVVAAPARAAPTITMSGDQVVGALVADLAYFYRHAVPRAPDFSLSGGNTSTGIADTQRGVSDAGLVSRNLLADDPPGLRAHPAGHQRHLPHLQSRQPGAPAHALADPGHRGRTRDQLEPDPRLAAHRSDRARRPLPGHRRRAGLPLGLRRPRHADRVAAGHAAHLRPGPRLRRANAGGRWGTSTWHSPSRCTRSPTRAWAARAPRSRDSSYPARRPLGVVTRGRPRAALARFLRWARTSRTARRVIATRYIPLSEARARR